MSAAVPVVPALVAALLAGGVLALGPSRPLATATIARGRPLAASVPAPARRAILPAACVVLVAVAAAQGSAVRGLLLLGAAGVIVRGATSLLAARGRRARLAARQAQVRDACEALAAELASGRPSALALEAIAVRWPMLAPVARACDLGGDVPEAWREVALTPGLGALRAVAAAWEVSWRSGAALAPAIDAVAQRLRADAATSALVAGELASARATARLVALLPVAAWGIGSGSGARPLSFLLGSTAGLLCLVAGLACAGIGLRWLESIAADAEHRGVA
ncbi:type II secretion system protein [Nocardioides sp. TRM66260-LWL]|uniref:type II secretion system F family protein n=1 Tax=Nocardioides sp. TRM66260-LWL TaxID=2874478 RepID=UPI001CC585E8|nr:type II secretion system protein [Nocardioides sp. TRM66260-LWL]MBZ5736348.1 type II secretion system protein [Nocardioides sp. TRM66260-LWL]